MLGALSKEIYKTFVPGDRSFKEFSYAHAIMQQDLHLFPCKIQILQLQTDTNKAERRAFE